MILPFLALTSVLQVAVNPLPSAPNVEYRFIVSEEGNTPVAMCDSQFTCHCPTGYKAQIRQSAASVAAISVVCEPVATSSGQLRETFDSYPQLPMHENFGK